VKDENGDLLADSHNIFNRWKNYFSQLLNVHNVSDVRKIEVAYIRLSYCTCSSHLEAETGISNLKKYKLLYNSHTTAESIQASGETLQSANQYTH
jgi:hypothetical protein